MSDFESGAFNRALPPLRFKPLRLNHLQCYDETLNAVVSLGTGHLEWQKMPLAMANDFGPSSSPKADVPSSPR